VTQNRNILNKRESSIVGAIDYQIPVTQLRVLGALRVFWGDLDDATILGVPSVRLHKVLFNLLVIWFPMEFLVDILQLRKAS